MSNREERNRELLKDFGVAQDDMDIRRAVAEVEGERRGAWVWLARMKLQAQKTHRELTLLIDKLRFHGVDPDSPFGKEVLQRTLAMKIARTRQAIEDTELDHSQGSPLDGFDRADPGGSLADFDRGEIQSVASAAEQHRRQRRLR